MSITIFVLLNNIGLSIYWTTTVSGLYALISTYDLLCKIRLYIFSALIGHLINFLVVTIDKELF